MYDDDDDYGYYYYYYYQCQSAVSRELLSSPVISASRLFMSNPCGLSRLAMVSPYLHSFPEVLPCYL